MGMESVDNTDDAFAYNEVEQASIPEMMDVCCRDMVLRDRNTLIYPKWVGMLGMFGDGTDTISTGPKVVYPAAPTYNPAEHYDALSGPMDFEPERAPQAAVYHRWQRPAAILHQGSIVSDTKAWDPVSDGANPDVGYDRYKALFAPLQGYKYDPFAMRLKFKIIRKRWYYNTTNVVQQVQHYLLSRKHKQNWGKDLTDDSKVTPLPDEYRACMGDVWTVLDVLPYRDMGRMQYNAAQGLDKTTYYRPQSAAVFFADGKTFPEDAVLQITQAGEVYKKFAHVRHIGMSTQWLRAIYARPPAIPGTVSFYPNGPADQGFYDQSTLSGNYNWDSLGIHAQNSIPSVSGAYTQSQLVGQENIGPNPGSPPFDWTLNPNWTPLKNPFLKRLFRIGEKRMTIPPGGVQVVTHRTRSKRGGINLWHSGSIRDCRFFYGPDDLYMKPYGKVHPSHLEWMNAVYPYNNPYAKDWKPPLLVYAAKRQCGFQTSDLWVTVRGQMSYHSDGASPPSLAMNYAPGCVTYRERTIVKCKVVSYGRRRVTGGKSFYINELSPSVGTYNATNPTVQPTAPAFSVIPPAVS